MKYIDKVFPKVCPCLILVWTLGMVRPIDLVPIRLSLEEVSVAGWP